MSPKFVKQARLPKAAYPPNWNAVFYFNKPQQEIMERQFTQEIKDLIETFFLEDIEKELSDIQQHAYINAAKKIRSFIFTKLLKEVEKSYPIMTDFVTNSLSKVDWENIGDYFLRKFNE